MPLDKNAGPSVVPVKKKVLQYFYLNHPYHIESKEKSKQPWETSKHRREYKAVRLSVINNSHVTIPHFLTLHTFSSTNGSEIMQFS